MNKTLQNKVVRWGGIVSSAVILVLWLLIIQSKQDQYTNPGATGTWAIGRWIIDAVDAKMILLALLGALAALAQSPLVILLVFLLIFWPVGLYTLGVPGWAKFVGISSLLFLLSGVLMLSLQYKNRKVVSQR